MNAAPQRRWLRVALRVLVPAVLLAIVALLWMWGLWRATPEHWQTVDANDANVAPTAARFEQWVVAEFTEIRPADQPWRIELDQRQINRWLATRGKQWAVNQSLDLPAELGEVIVVLQPGRAIAAAGVDYGTGRRILSVVYEPVPAQEGEPARLELSGGRMGRLPLPETAILAWLPDLPSHMQSIALSVPLGDGRVVHVTNIVPAEGRVVLTCRTRR